MLAKVLVTRYAEVLTDTIEKIVNIYEANINTASRKRAILLRNISIISNRIMIGGLTGSTFVAIVHYINPIYMYYWQNEYSTLFPLYIPFIDEKTAHGFVVLMIIQTVEVFCASIASASVDIMFAMIVVNILIFANIFVDYVNELNGNLRKDEMIVSFAKIKLKNVIDAYNDIWM